MPNMNPLLSQMHLKDLLVQWQFRVLGPYIGNQNLLHQGKSFNLSIFRK